MTTLTQDLNTLRELRLKELDLKGTYEDAKREREQQERSVFERMASGDGTGEAITSINVGDVNFVRYTTTYGSIEDREAFLEWAKTHDENLVEEKERKALISELVRERLDNGEPLPPGVSFYTQEKVAQRAG